MTWSCGDRCVIADTAYVLGRCPEIIGTIADVLRLKPSALQTVSGSKAAAARAADDACESDDDADLRASPARALKRGTLVSVRATDNAQARAPHLVGRVGTVKEVPAHPNTWFKVEFAADCVFTFRPSALRRVQANGSGSEAESAGRKRFKGGSDDDDESEPRLVKGKPLTAKEKKLVGVAAGAKESRLLSYSSLDAEKWVGLHVRIKAGRLAGSAGRILRSGNGWVQLRTQQGEVAKRAYELELLGESEAPPDLRESDRLAAASQQAAAAKPVAKLGTAPAAPPGPAAAGKVGTRPATRASQSSAGGDDDFLPAGPRPASPVPPLRVAVPRPGADLRGPQLLSPARGRGDKSATAKQAAYREAVRKHLDRARDKHKDRPNLAKWLVKIQGGRWDAAAAFNAAFGGADTMAEAAAIGDAVTDDRDEDAALLAAPRWKRRAVTRAAVGGAAVLYTGCAMCRMEKDQGSCWNPRCVASPAYDAAAPEAPVDRPAKRAKGTRSSTSEPAAEPAHQSALSLRPVTCSILTYISRAPTKSLGKPRTEFSATDKPEAFYDAAPERDAAVVAQPGAVMDQPVDAVMELPAETPLQLVLV
ncbi:hypothetical protein M885DRAFT_590975 [Pelagophyceae sp. CCMP2097]|nr:hypothetical protein M885DRAFT_590975 [Pelagophyceae sp. CCMP2097]